MKWLTRLIILALLSLLLGSELLHATGVSAEEQTFGQTGDEAIATVSGRVTTEIGGNPFAGIHVILVDPDDTDVRVHVATTDDFGNYTFIQTVSDTWYLLFEWQNESNEPYTRILPEYYNNVENIAQATPITIEVGTKLTNINGTLASAGQVTGRVTAENDGTPLAEVQVNAYEGFNYLGQSTLTDSSGVYTLSLGMNQRYKFLYDPPDSSPYALEYYNDALTYESAQSFLPPQDRVTRIDVALAIGGAITGTITSSWLNKPLSHPTILVQDLQGGYVQHAITTLYHPDYPDSHGGHYVAYNLPIGDYQIFATGEYHRPQRRAELVRVEADTITTDIDVRLALTPQIASIATSPFVPDTFVIIMSHDPKPLLTMNGGLHWHVLSSATWANEDFFAYPDAPRYFGFVAGIAPRGAAHEGTRLFVAAPKSTMMPAPFNPGIFRSGDNGQSWAESIVDPSLEESQCSGGYYDTPMVSAVAPHKTFMLFRCETLEGTFSRVLVSDNNAVTWRDVTTRDERTLLLNSESRLVASPHHAGELYVFDGMSQWYKSTNQGVDWHTVNFPFESLVFDAANPNFLTGITQPHASPSMRLGKRSQDGGATWQDWAQQPCPNVNSYYPPQLVAHPTESKVIFMRCDNMESPGIYRSDNQGDAWKRLTEEAGQMLAIDYGVPGRRPVRILWARDDGLWASRDLGESWEVVLVDYQTHSRPLYLPSVRSHP